MRRIHKLACSLFMAIPLAAVASCSSGGSSVASGPPPELSTITVDAVPTADAAGLYIALDNGYFAQQGLTVNIVRSLGGEFGMQDLQGKKVQLVEGNYVSFILSQVAGRYKGKPIDMRIIANTSQIKPGNQALYVRPGSKFKTVADLAKYHAKIGVNSPNNIGQVLLGSLFQENGLTLDQKQVSFQPLPAMPQLLQNGQLDAAWLPEPFGTIAEQQFGAVQLADFDQGSLQGFPIGCIVGDKQWIQDHPNTVAAFLRAFEEGQQVADTDRAAVEQALEKHTGTPPGIAATMTLDTYPLTMDVPVMQRVPNAMFQFGVLDKRFQITQMIAPQPGMVGG